MEARPLFPRPLRQRALQAHSEKEWCKGYFCERAISEGPEGIILEAMLVGYAEFYSAELSEKIHRGQKENALKGKNNGGGVPLGYLLDKKAQKLVIDPTTAPLVVEIFEKYADGKTVRSIVEDFNARGLRTKKGQPFNINSFSSLLKNRKYIGEYRYQDVVIEGGVPAIIPEGLFNRVQERMEKNRHAPAMAKAKEDYLLTTKLFCGKCERMMVGESGKSHTGAMHYYYKCSGAKRLKDCDKKAVRKDWIERVVVRLTMQRVMDEEKINRLIDAILVMQEQEDTTTPALRSQLAEIESSIGNILKAIEQGIFTPSTKQRLDELEARKEEILVNIQTAELQKPKLTREQIGQRAGLVEHDGVRLGHRLQKASALDGDVIAAALPHGGQHRDGDGQLERTGEVHHQHREHFRHIPGQKIGQRRAAQRIGHQSVRHLGGFVLGGGFQLLRLLDHANYPVIPPVAGGFLHGDDALTLLRHRPGIDGTAGVLRHGHGLAGEGRLVHHGLALHHQAVQRDHTAGADHDTVARLHVGDLRQHLDAVCLLPDAVHPQAHGGGEVGNRLLVGPLLQNFAQMQHEHNGAGGGKIAPCHGHRNSGGIQHGDGQFAVPQCRKPLPDVLYGAEQCQRRGDGYRQEQLGDAPPHDGDSKLVLKLPVQCPGVMLRHQLHGLRLGEGETCQRTNYVSALRLIEHHGVLRPVVDLDRLHAVLGAQIVFQHIRLGYCHPPAAQVYPQSQYGPPEARVYCRTKSVTPPDSLMV